MGIAGGDWGTVGKEVRWLQAEQVPPRPLAINGRNCCFASRTCDTSAGQKDARQSCQMNEAWQAPKWGWKSGASGQKLGISQVQSGCRTLQAELQFVQFSYIILCLQ